ncbi:ribosomal protein L22, bacterial type [Actinobacteria bacterium IMCC26207]|nr:ribosomal protein L22, bacterial type [Actinobacteria bacterium IMCC26207]
MASIQFDERKTNERPGVRAVHRSAGFSAYKAREVLDLIRNKSVAEARTILQFCERSAADEVAKVLDSAVANAANNNDIPPDELFVSACYADEGSTMKRWRPRARGRATRIRKRTCHITVIVGRYTQTELDRRNARLAAKGQTASSPSADRARRVSRSRSGEPKATESVGEAAAAVDESAVDETAVDETAVDDAVTTDPAEVVDEAAETAVVADEAAEAGETEEVPDEAVEAEDVAQDAASDDDSAAESDKKED